MAVSAIILAGGNSSRFKSPVPKILYPLLEKPLIEYLLDTLSDLDLKEVILVTGARTHQALKQYQTANCHLAFQEEPLGTFHALETGFKKLEKLRQVDSSDHLIVLNADTPMVKAELLEQIIDSPDSNIVITRQVEDPTGLGRVLKDSEGLLSQIIEEKELSSEQKLIKEINAGLYKINALEFKACASQNFETQEQYLTSYLGSYLPECLRTTCLPLEKKEDWTLIGVNSFEDFQNLENKFLQQGRLRLLEQGALLTQSESITVYPDVTVEPGVRISGPCVLKGPLHLSSDVIVEPFSVLEKSEIGAQSHLKSFCYIKDSSIGTQNHLGPFLRCRDQVNTENGVHLGNFLEVKSSEIQRASKAKHFGYIGQAYIGQNVNIGAGTIFCNYDGKKKQATHIGHRSFIGSATQLVAPLTIGEDCYIGASTLVTRSLENNSLMTRRSPAKVLIKTNKSKEIK